MTYTKIHWWHIDPPLQDGDVLEECVLAQLQPGTVICAGVRDLTLRNCVAVNVVPQPTWRIERGNWSHTEYCSHDRPELMAKGLPVCREDCSHRQGATKQWVDIPEKEYRDLKAAALQRGTPLVQIVKATDAAGVVIQTFQKSVYVYKSRLVATGSHVLRAAAAIAAEGKP